MNKNSQQQPTSVSSRKPFDPDSLPPVARGFRAKMINQAKLLTVRLEEDGQIDESDRAYIDDVSNLIFTLLGNEIARVHAAKSTQRQKVTPGIGMSRREVQTQ